MKSLNIQLRVIYALLMREIITRYGRHNLGFAWLFVEPMMFTLGVATLWTLSSSFHHSTLPIVPFAVTGYSAVLLWRNAANRVGNAVEANSGLLYHRNVKAIDVFLARIFLEMVGATMSFLFLSVFFISIGLMKLPEDLLLIILGWGLLAWFAVALGLIIGGLSEISEVIDRFWHTFTYLLFPFSGTAFFVEWLPKKLQDIVLLLPMVHGTEMIRHGYYGSLIPTYENALYMIKINLCLLLLGLILVKYASKKIEVAS